MALNVKGIGTAVKQDSVQFFLGVASPELPSDWTGYFEYANKVANIRTTGDFARQREQIDATCLDSMQKLNVPGFQEATTVDMTLAVVAGAQDDLEDWYQNSTQLLWGYVAFDNQQRILYAKGGTCTIGTATLTGAQVGNLVETSVQLNIESTLDFSKSPITPGGHGAPIQVTGATISGTLESASGSLTCETTPATATVTYKWEQADSASGPFSEVSGQTSKTLNLSTASITADKYVRCTVTGSGTTTGTAVSNVMGPTT